MQSRPIALPRLPLRRRGTLAAALDGEGWVSKRVWVVEVGNTNRPWLLALRSFVGDAGSIREDRSRRRPRHWKRFWRWRIYGATACALLTQVMPDLIVKRSRAERFVRRYRALHPGVAASV
jgi:hypothetical protein